MDKMFRKTVWKTLTHNKARFGANFAMVAISLIVAGGLGEMPRSYLESYSHNYDGRSVPDLIVKSATGSFTDEQKTLLSSQEGLDGYDEVTVIDVSQDESRDTTYTRIYIMDLSNIQIGNLTLLEGEALTETSQICSGMGHTHLAGHTVGQTVQVNYKSLMVRSIDSLIEGISLPESLSQFKEVLVSMLEGAVNNMDPLTYTVNGIYDDTLYNSAQNERALLEGEEEEYINRVFYLDRGVLQQAASDFQEELQAALTSFDINVLISLFNDITPLVNLVLGNLPATDIHLRYSTEYEYFSPEYREFAESKKSAVSTALGADAATILTLEENASYALFENYNQKVSTIVRFIPFIFLVVAALMSSLMVSRLIKDERAQIATCMSLGVSKGKIVGKYLFFTFLSVGLGAVIGYFIGTPLIPTVILPAYSVVFQMGPMPINFFNWYGLAFVGAIILIGFLLTLYQIFRYIREAPATLFQEEAPKPGKKTLLEHIPFLWKPLPFRYKSSVRNIFRQWKNSLLTSLSIILATTLIFFGFALGDTSRAMKSDSIYSGVGSSMNLISALIVVLALALGITVIYSLTNMNIEDRKRELATLRVLGYQNRECSMYTFREIMIITIFSSLIALPLSALLVWWLFDYLDFGSISDVQPLTYILSFMIVVLLTVITNLLLYHRVKAIDMNSSLKSLD